MERFTRFSTSSGDRGRGVGTIAGIALIAVAVGQWIARDLGPLDYAQTMRWVIPGTILHARVQTVLSSSSSASWASPPMNLVGGLHAGLSSAPHSGAGGYIAPLCRAVPPCWTWVRRRAARADDPDQRPDLVFTGMDVLVRPRTHIPVREFDGFTLPMGDRAVDAILLVDVLHHADDPIRLLKEVARVARQAIIIKDHMQAGWIDRQTLRLMDWTGNAAHGVALPTTTGPPRSGPWRSSASAPPSSPGIRTWASTRGRPRRSSTGPSLCGARWRGSRPAADVTTLDTLVA